MAVREEIGAQLPAQPTLEANGKARLIGERILGALHRECAHQYARER
jgi:hypothetical protein